MVEPNWRIVIIRKSVMCLLCIVVMVETAITVEDVVALVVTVGLVAMAVTLMDEVEEEMTG
jgi:hypothetical protein